MRDDINILVNDDDELESQTLNQDKGKPYRKPTGDDPISDWLLKYYLYLESEPMAMVKYAVCAAPLLLIFLFQLFVSDSTSNLIAFSALVISLFFIVVSLWILCWILDKDQGSRAMQDISDPIREGSEGFFIT